MSARQRLDTATNGARSAGVDHATICYAGLRLAVTILSSRNYESVHAPMSSLDSIPAKILSAGMVIVHFDGQRYRLLAIRTFSSWDFPNTLVPDGEDPLQVATREAQESTDLADLEFPWGDALRETLAFENGGVTRYYIAESKSADVTLRIPPGDGGEEDFEYRWVTAEEAEEILPPRLGLILEWALKQLAAGTR